MPGWATWVMERVRGGRSQEFPPALTWQEGQVSPEGGVSGSREGRRSLGNAHLIPASVGTGGGVQSRDLAPHQTPSACPLPSALGPPLP